MKLFRSKLFLFALAIVLISGALMVAAYTGNGRNTAIGRAVGAVVTTAENAVSSVSGWFSNVFGYFYRYSALVEENEALRRELGEARALESEYFAAVQENDDLRRLNKLRERNPDYECALSSIVSVSGTGFQGSFTINRGTNADIETGDPVVTSDGGYGYLVGYVSEVGPNYAEVVTVVNLSSKAGALITRTREPVVAEGDFELAGKGLFKLSYLSNDADIREGDWVETSGSGGNYPRGLLIGRVEEYLLESHGISSYATVRPAVDIGSLKSVFVITGFNQDE